VAACSVAGQGWSGPGQDVAAGGGDADELGGGAEGFQEVDDRVASDQVVRGLEEPVGGFGDLQFEFPYGFERVVREDDHGFIGAEFVRGIHGAREVAAACAVEAGGETEGAAGVGVLRLGRAARDEPDLENIPVEDGLTGMRMRVQPRKGSVEVFEKLGLGKDTTISKPYNRADAEHVRDEEVEQPGHPVWRGRDSRDPLECLGAVELHGGTLESAVVFGKRGSGFDRRQPRDRGPGRQDEQDGQDGNMGTGRGRKDCE
jgi:hypothetical protein